MSGNVVAFTCWGKVVLTGWIFFRGKSLGLSQSKYMCYSQLKQLSSCFSPAPAWFFSTSCSPSGKNLLHHGLSRGCREVSARAPGGLPPSLSWVPAGLISHSFFPHSWQLCSFPLLQSVTTEAPPVLMMGSPVWGSGAAVELAGTGWNQLCQAWGSPDLSSQRFSPTPGHGHLIHQVSSVLASFKIASLPSPADACNTCVVGYPGIQR